MLKMSDEYAMLAAMVLTVIARAEPDWKEHEFWAQIQAMVLSAGLGVLSLYILARMFD